MDEIKPISLDTYKGQLELHANKKTAAKVSNGGLPYAAILMGTMFKYCNGMARIYCQGLKPQLVCEPPFWEQFSLYALNPKNKLYILIDSTAWIDNPPMKLLKKIKKERVKKEHIIEYRKKKLGNGKKRKSKKVKEIIIPDTSIIVKLIHPDHIKKIAKIYGESTHFSVFDNEKFRYEYDSENYKAYGSFNQPDTAAQLIDMFDEIFNDPKSKIII